ncbi:MAG: hypothetical protein HKN76_19900 [Saprospiraceae bacterium]|nr:hypothetical protein [Saprospiraceae bacterium]
MNNYKNITLTFLMGAILLACGSEAEKVLVFSKTTGFRHSSIEPGVEAIKKLGQKNGFDVVATEDASHFVEESLKEYAAVIFLNTSGDVLDYAQQADFERYIQAGGGFVGVHAATDTEYDWPWYNDLVGAYFAGHPEIQTATLNIIDKNHPSTDFLTETWDVKDEWYNFKSINPNVNVLIEIDENSYQGGTNGVHHPIAWYHEYDGGRAFYTELGHTEEAYENEIYLRHLLGGIRFSIGNNSIDYTKSKTDRVPDESRFVKTVLDFNLNEPMELDELPGIGILFVERRGLIKLYDFKTEKTVEIAQMDLFYGNEDGLLGLAVDPDYERNNWIYLFYSAPGNEPIQHVSRFSLADNKLDFSSEKILLKIPTIRKCCHSGGALEFGPEGNLFITLGDNTNPFESEGYAPIDEREGRALWDAQKSAANTNDLRGKILRIKPEQDGTYSIPEGNLFPVGTPKTRPEIYVMGCRNPFRPSIDSKTGYLYWGDIGPDAGKGNEDRGPKGMGEFDQARKSGFWGWPYTRGNNQVYNDFDFATKTSGNKFDPDHLINNSPNNTGIQELPPVQKSLIWFSYDRSDEFPWLGTGGVNPMAGPVFHASDYPNAEERFPEYFEDKLFVYEWMRDWIYVVTLDENYDYVKADPFMASSEFSHPMDMIFGSDGALYVLEYGQKWNARNLDARLSRINYLPGNRPPIAKITADKLVGPAPLTIQFSALESQDYDGDELEYAWSFTGEDDQSMESEPQFTFQEPGDFIVELKVKDEHGVTHQAQSRILVGNTPPELSIEISPADTFYDSQQEIQYRVSVTDFEDGTTADGSIESGLVKVTFDYVPEGKDKILATVGHQQDIVPEGQRLMNNTDCKACHAKDVKVNGPSYLEIAEKYTIKDRNHLIGKVIKGGAGVWGETAMAAHPQLKINEVGLMIDYIFSLKADESRDADLLPLNGNLEFNRHKHNQDDGIYILTASYLDEGNPAVPGSMLSVQKQLVFRANKEANESTLEIE